MWKNRLAEISTDNVCSTTHTVRSPTREKDVERESASSAVTAATGTKKWLELSTHTESWPNGMLSDSIG
jgi:hypothetical protein